MFSFVLMLKLTFLTSCDNLKTNAANICPGGTAKGGNLPDHKYEWPGTPSIATAAPTLNHATSKHKNARKKIFCFVKKSTFSNYFFSYLFHTLLNEKEL